MKNLKLFLFLLLLLFPVCVSAYNDFDFLYTESNCNISKEDCKSGSCVYFESKGCGVSTAIDSYKCYYTFEKDHNKFMVTAYFNANGLQTLELKHKDPVNNIQGVIYDKNIESKQKHFQVIEGSEVYFCPYQIYYIDVGSGTDGDYNTINYNFSTARVNNGTTTIRYGLSYSGTTINNLMMIKSTPDGNNNQSETLDPLVCKHKIEIHGVQREVVITYVGKNTVSAELIGEDLQGFSYQVNTDYILHSEQLKNWKCAENVYADFRDDVYYISYDKEDIGEDAFEHEGDSNNNNNNNNNEQHVTKCELIPPAIHKYIDDALNLIRWVGLVALIILGTLDFVKATASGDQDALKKAWQKFTKRLIAVIILFLIPMLVDLILVIAQLTDLGC